MPDIDFSQPVYFPWDSPELKAYVRAADEAGYETKVEMYAYVRSQPRPPRPPLEKDDLGIDVSHWQRKVIWPEVAAAGVEFAFIKASEGRLVDEGFARHWNAARAAHLHCGAYMFFLPGMLPEAQVEIFANLLSTYWQPSDLSPVVDVEYMHYMGNPRPEEWLARLEQVLTLVEQATGKRPYIYTNTGALQRLFRWQQLETLPAWAGQYPLWVAHYTNRPQPLLPRGWTTYHIWQFDNGQQPWSRPVPGIGRCDRNRWGEHPFPKPADVQAEIEQSPSDPCLVGDG